MRTSKKGAAKGAAKNTAKSARASADTARAARFAKLRAKSDEEIEAAALADSDHPPATTAELAGMRPLRENKEPVTIRVDADILNAYKATGKKWQSRMHDAIAAGAPGREGEDGAAVLERLAAQLRQAAQAMRGQGRQ